MTFCIFLLILLVLVDEVELNSSIFCCFCSFSEHTEMRLDLLLLDGNFEGSSNLFVEDW